MIMSKMFISLTSLQSFYSFNKQTAIQIVDFYSFCMGCGHAHSNQAITLGNIRKLFPGLGMGNYCISRQYVLYNNTQYTT